jgi:hypothetical protein
MVDVLIHGLSKAEKITTRDWNRSAAAFNDLAAPDAMGPAWR